MNYTLDTAAIRKRFNEVVVGSIDGQIAILILMASGLDYFDIVTGCLVDADTLDAYDWLIRPGDRCEVDVCGDWEMATYRGMTGDWGRPFYAQVHGDTLTLGFDNIRPLPAPVAEVKPATSPEGQWISVNDRLPEKGSRILLYDCNEDGDGFGVLTGRYSDAGWYLEGELSGDATITHWMPLPIPPITPVAEKEPTLGIALTREQVTKLELAYANSLVMAAHSHGLQILQKAVQEILEAWVTLARKEHNEP